MKIIPHRGVDAVLFGMSRSEVRRVMGNAPTVRPVGPFTPRESDLFRESLMTIFYDDDYNVSAIEFGSRSKQPTILEYEGKSLFTQPAREIREWARQLDPDLECDMGFKSKLLGLSMYAPGIDAGAADSAWYDDPAQTFLIFRPGYPAAGG